MTIEQSGQPSDDAQAALSGMVLDLEILRFVRDSTDRSSGVVLKELEKHFQGVPRAELTASLDRVMKFTWTT